MAGELEIIASPDVASKEKEARTLMVKTLCYHKMYLDDGDLRDGYDSILKKVEQGKLTWSPSLAEELHNHLDYQANVYTRNKMAQESFTRVENKRTPAADSKRPDGGATEKVVY